MSNIETITFNSEYFDVLSTLECGQIFRFNKIDKGYLVLSKDKGAIVHTENNKTIIQCNTEDRDYFINFFDLDRDYNQICQKAIGENLSILSKAVDCGKGIRILNQDKEETLFSFIISQNNNIPRIKGIIEKLCSSLGEKREFLGVEYYTFPTVKKMAEAQLSFYQKIGLGYRAKYIKELAESLNNGLNLQQLNALSTKDLRKNLLSILGVGNKVADCVLLFGFHRSDSFPVDTWIEKVYKEDLKGDIKDRTKISDYLVERFKENSGYYQQYLFYYKRSHEKKD